jgi:hypothetical protein
VGAAALAGVPAVYYLIAVNNERNVDYVNNAFFTFWLSGRLPGWAKPTWLRIGQHSRLWLHLDSRNDFPYPCRWQCSAPIGTLPDQPGLCHHRILAQVLVALCILAGNHWDSANAHVCVF